MTASSNDSYDFQEAVKAITKKVAQDLLGKLLTGQASDVETSPLESSSSRVRRDAQRFRANGRWTADEDATLRFLYRRFNKEQLGELLGRSLSSIATRASMLGLKRRST